MTVKKTIPNPSEAKSDADHLKFAEHALSQIKAGHYGVKNVSVTQTNNSDGSVHISASFDRTETNPSVGAVPHNL